MKWLLIVVMGLCVVGLLAYIVMAVQSQKRPEMLGLQQGLLYPCPDSPNCVCSEAHSQNSDEHGIDPVSIDGDTWVELKHSMIAMGGIIEQDDGEYLHATFVSSVFRYVDDVELRCDERDHLIHIRSASRAGRTDFGVNRKRVAQIIYGAIQIHGAIQP